jgi:hypothetical protein
MEPRKHLVKKKNRLIIRKKQGDITNVVIKNIIANRVFGQHWGSFSYKRSTNPTSSWEDLWG